MDARFAQALVAIPLLVGVDDPRPVLPPLPVHSVEGTEQVHARMNLLVNQVGERLRAIDELLWEAPGAPELGSLLEDATRRSRQTIDDIDELLALAKHPHPGEGGGT